MMLMTITIYQPNELFSAAKLNNDDQQYLKLMLQTQQAIIICILTTMFW